ncbi:hypothetical protein AcV7_002061 [Taiwanofungus camphoratus]|nr:hypothetical protein AcV7_002061 [Antrodia cinnamomea]
MSKTVSLVSPKVWPIGESELTNISAENHSLKITSREQLEELLLDLKNMSELESIIIDNGVQGGLKADLSQSLWISSLIRQPATLPNSDVRKIRHLRLESVNFAIFTKPLVGFISAFSLWTNVTTLELRRCMFYNCFEFSGLLCTIPTLRYFSAYTIEVRYTLQGQSACSGEPDAFSRDQLQDQVDYEQPQGQAASEPDSLSGANKPGKSSPTLLAVYLHSVQQTVSLTSYFFTWLATILSIRDSKIVFT